MSAARTGSAKTTASKGWLTAHRWLLLRRTSQLAILALFLAGPWLGIRWLTGSLAASRLFDAVPLTDPLLLLETLFAGHRPAMTALVGAAVVIGFYALVGGRAYCAWVCPLNMVTDAAAWLRRRFGIGEGIALPRQARYWMMAMVLLLAAVTGTVAWEVVNPVTSLHRGLLFGVGLGWAVVLAVFLFDLLISRRGWCGHLCPMGAGYSLPGLVSPVRVGAVRREQCNNCGDCYAVCPEPQVIAPALRGADAGRGPMILSPNCTNCGRCIDVCNRRVFAFGTRFRRQTRG